MKLIQALLSAILIVLCLNTYFTYRGALVYGKVPLSRLGTHEANACLVDVMSLDCPKEWHLNGTGY